MEREDTALAEVVFLYSDFLLSFFQKEFKVLERNDIMTVMDDLFMSLWERPGQYDPARSKLKSYLVMALRGDLRNAVKRKEQRREIHAVDVELIADSLEQEAEDPWQTASDREKLERIYGRLREIFPFEPDYTVACMVVEGIRSREKYARVLGLEDLPPDEYASEVDRAKDRVKKKLNRNNWKEFLEQNK